MSKMFIFQFTTVLFIVSTGICHAKVEKIKPVVVLRDLNNGHNVVDKNIKLECQTTFYAKYVSIEWKTPEDVKHKNVSLRENVNSGYITTSTLVIRDAEIEHSGLYFCEVFHKQINHTLATKKMLITVYEAREGDLEINTKYITKKTHAEVEVQVKAHPRMTAMWFDSNVKMIKNASNVTMSVAPTPYDEQYNYKAEFSLNYVTSNDLGLYEILVGNGFSTLSHYFDIYPTNSTDVYLELVSVNEDEMTARYQCTALGNPKPNITWIFESCGIFQCLNNQGRNSTSTKQIILEGSNHKDRGLLMVSSISISLADVGMVKCVVQDTEDNHPNFYTRIEFDFFFENENSDNSKYHKLYAGYFESLVAVCSRSLHKYTPYLFWYHNGKNINTTDLKYVENFYNPLDRVVNVLRIKYLPGDQLGNFTCQVLTRTGEVESKTVEVVSKNMSNLYPEISLEDLNGGQTTVGQDIRLVCNATFYLHVDIVWAFLRAQHGDRLRNEKALKYAGELYSSIDHKKMSLKTDVRVTDPNTYTTTSYLTISSANVSETGYYGCKTGISEFYNENFIWVRIYGLNETSLIFEQKNNFDKEDMNIKISITSHPKPTVKWFDNCGMEILLGQRNSSNFLISSNHILNRTENNANYEVILTFKSLDTRHFGNYTIVAENGYEAIEHSIQVNVTGVPTAKIDIYNISTGNATLKCRSTGYPKPTIEWYFKKCTTLECLLEVGIKSLNTYLHLNELWNENSGLQNISYVSVNLSERGVLVCRSANSLGQNYTYEPILGFDTEFEMSIENADNREHLNERIDLIGRKTLKFICGASKLKYTNKFVWSTSRYQDDSHEISTFHDLKTKASLDFLFTSFIMRTELVSSPSKKEYNCHVLKKDDGTLSSQTFQVESRLSAYVTIFKTNLANNSVQVDVRSKRKFYCYAEGFPAPTVKWYKNNQNILYSEKLKLTNEGQVLEIDYIDPDDEGIYKCEVSNKYKESVKYISVNVVIKYRWPYVQAVLVLFAFFFITVLVFIMFRKEKKIEKKLKLLGLIYLEKDSWKKINSKLNTEDGDVLLPFDRKWEIPLENVKIGKRLGSGAFGVTYQATVVNFFPNDGNKTVAIKSVNSSSDFECAKALVSELKILSHLGSHVNIVNFLGACTRHILKDELYVVLEFCSFGNLLDHINRCSQNFINQKDYDSDVFNWTGSGSTDYVENSKNNNSVSSKDFLIWSFQIARGMEYLGFRRVVHGDLAARNVLLTDKNVVKVCDFGLAKNVYNYGKYVKKSKGRLPLKWMAVEAIEKGIYSTQSDVWSFGMILWEFFSLGKIPYSGIDVDENFCKKLINGYRMEPPDTATTKIYNIMLACWQLDPGLRPSFSDLVEQIGSFLEESVKNLYVEMNSPYVLMNEEHFDGRFDYLTMVNPATYQNVVSRNYEKYLSFHSSDNTDDNLEADYNNSK